MLFFCGFAQVCLREIILLSAPSALSRLVIWHAVYFCWFWLGSGNKIGDVRIQQVCARLVESEVLLCSSFVRLSPSARDTPARPNEPRGEGSVVLSVSQGAAISADFLGLVVSEVHSVLLGPGLVPSRISILAPLMRASSSSQCGPLEEVHSSLLY